MTWEHNHLARELAFRLNLLLDRGQYEVIHDSGRVRRSERNYFIPDVCVVPREVVRRAFPAPGMTELYAEPLPLVVEVWSPATGDYDAKEKVDEYQRRGDAEIWLMHPYEHTLRAWRRRADGGYDEALHTSGVVEPAALSGVRLDLDALWES